MGRIALEITMDFRYTSDEFEQIKPFLKDLFNQCKNDGNFNKYKNVLSAFIDVLNFSNEFLKDIDDYINTKEPAYCVSQRYISLQTKLATLQTLMDDDVFGETNRIEKIKHDIIGDFFIINYECLYWYIFYKYENINHSAYNKCKSIVQIFEKNISVFEQGVVFDFVKIATNTLKFAYDRYMQKNESISQKLRDLDNFTKEIENNSSRCENLKLEIQNIENSLQNQRQEFNFIGLSNAFQKMKDDKNEELKNENSNNKIFMRCIIGILLAKLMWSVHYMNFETYNPTTLTVITISSIFIVGILLYFFRISLHNIKAIQSQILQLDLRLSLCQFIHNYATDSKEMRENMKESLERFESVIFAPIVATDDKIPTTLDGMEQLGKLIDMVKKP